ncbi:sensor histidine kinase [Galactobacter valiniphilus]|uniref:sensor histidine kinase n=1 Tax=Galactobacter valiniphilus TaxID=2676122 RepID=UPI003734C270
MARSEDAPRRPTLAGQLLALQILVLLGVLAGVLYLVLGQSLRSFEEQEGRRVLATAETLAATPVVRTSLSTSIPGSGTVLPAALESVRSISGLTEAALMKADGTVVAATDTSLLGHAAPDAFSQGALVRAWSGAGEVQGRRLLAARVPVIDEDGSIAGAAVASIAYPGWDERLADAAPDLVVTGIVTGAVGLGGSWLLSRRLKRQTLGMEPNEIAALVEHREALLHGVKEGVVAVDADGRLSVLTDAARDLLGWHDVRVGTRLRKIDAPADVLAALGGTSPVVEVPLTVGDRLLVANRGPIDSHGRTLGTVTTLRDRTELLVLRDALDATTTTTDLLRAQTHEFANQLHTVAGLIQLGDDAEALRYVDAISRDRSHLVEAVTRRVRDSPLAALLVAKSSVAAERHVRLVIDEEAFLDEVDDALSRDLITVVGNLIDNALDAAAPSGGEVRVDLQDDGSAITVTVVDDGPGLGGVDPERIFARGFSTKDTANPAGRGFGLALVRHTTRRRGGDVRVEEDSGAVFTAVLPRPPAPSAGPAMHSREEGTTP